MRFEKWILIACVGALLGGHGLRNWVTGLVTQ